MDSAIMRWRISASLKRFELPEAIGAWRRANIAATTAYRIPLGYGSRGVGCDGPLCAAVVSGARIRLFSARIGGDGGRSAVLHRRTLAQLRLRRSRRPHHARVATHAWIHAVATGFVVAAGFGVGVTRAEWCVLVLAIVVVWMAEALNTAFEALCDVASPEFHPLVERSKDVAAGAVLLSAIGATVVGVLVFCPYVLALGR
jgi:diacylglycerol kinase (ATP)